MILYGEDGKPIETTVVHTYGVSFYADGRVIVNEDGVERRPDWQEAVLLRQGFIGVIGEDIARAAGLEPE